MASEWIPAPLHNFWIAYVNLRPLITYLFMGSRILSDDQNKQASFKDCTRQTLLAVSSREVAEARAFMRASIRSALSDQCASQCQQPSHDDVV